MQIHIFLNYIHICSHMELCVKPTYVHLSIEVQSYSSSG